MFSVKVILQLFIVYFYSWVIVCEYILIKCHMEEK